MAVNGVVLDSPAVKVGPGDSLTVDGKIVQAAEPTRLFRYHKPAGLVTTHRDPKGRPTVFDALPAGLPRLISIGRLDLSSEGLLLLTNDGELSRALELPATGLMRRYRVRAHGRIDQARLDSLKDGIVVDGVHYGPIEARLDKAKEAGDGSNLWITVTLTEGKNREIRRVLESLGLTVNRLIRLAYGPFALGELVRGAIEEVGPRVLREQLSGVIAPANLPTGERAAWPHGAAAASLAEPSRSTPSPSRRNASPPFQKPAGRGRGESGKKWRADGPAAAPEARTGARGAKPSGEAGRPRSGEPKPGSKAGRGQPRDGLRGPQSGSKVGRRPRSGPASEPPPGRGPRPR